MILDPTVDVATNDHDRCDYEPGTLRCVRRPHPQHPNAHVRVSIPGDLEAPEAD